MVDIRIVIEGGVLPHCNTDAATFSNSQRLREAFHKLLSQILNPEKFNLVIEAGAGYKNAAKAFKQYARIDTNTSLMIDLDMPKEFKQQRLDELELAESACRVFFMVQEMEAWILSQPDVIEKCFKDRYIRKRVTDSIEKSVATLFKSHPEQIEKPSEKLKVLLGRYYSEMKGDVEKAKKYGKLKDAPLLLENLDIGKLIDTFEDVKSLKNHIIG